jgi:hypothetical protein
MAGIPASARDFKPAEKAFDPIPEVDDFGDPTVLNVEVEKVTLRAIDESFRSKYNIEATHEFNFQFKVLDGDYKNRKIWGNAQALWYEGNCRLRLWAQAIMGVETFPDDYEFDSEHLVGQKCRVTVKNYNKKDGTKGESVGEVRRARPTADATAAPTTSRQQIIAGEEDPF